MLRSGCQFRPFGPGLLSLSVIAAALADLAYQIIGRTNSQSLLALLQLALPLPLQFAKFEDEATLRSQKLPRPI